MSTETGLSQLERNLALSSMVLFAISMIMPAFRFSPTDPWIALSSSHGYYPGVILLLLGWFGIVGPGAAWLANPAWLIGLIGLQRNRLHSAFGWSAAAVCISLLSFFVDEVPRDEGGGQLKIYSMGIGFYVWWSALALLATSSFLALRREMPNKSPEGTREGHSDEFM